MESFYGGRQGISFIIVKRFDGIDIEPNTSFTIKYFAFDVSKNSFILDENNTPILKTHITSKIYKDWKLHENDGSEIIYEEQTGKFPIEYAEGMIQCFAQGGMTTDVVNYGEYVIIDTPDKNNVDNGKIYRRGLDYQNDLAGAEYIGQIVGPQGDSPEIMMDSFTTLVEEGGPQISYEKEDIIPGMELGEDNQPIYNDAIKSSWVTIKDKFGIVAGCKIGFQFPYHVFSFTAKSVDAYVEGELIQRTDDKKHSYFSEWKISVPKGVKGDALSNLQIVNSMAKKGAKYYNDIDCTEEAGILEQDIAIEINNENYSDDASKGKPIILPKAKTRDVNIKYVKTEDTYKEIAIYKTTNYDKKDEQHSFITLGDYNMIHNISLSENGTLTIEYTHDDTKVYEKVVKWIKEVKFDKDKGQITLIFNTGDIQILNKQENEAITWIKDIYLNDKGELKIKYNTDPEKVPEGETEVDFQGHTINTNLIQWLKSITLDENTGKITIDYNTGVSEILKNKNGQEQQIKWINNTILTHKGELKVKYNIDPEKITENEEEIDFEGHVVNTEGKPIRWIDYDDNIEIKDPNGVVVQTGAPAVVIETNKINNYIDADNNIIGTADFGEASGSQKIKIKYNTEDNYIAIGNPINYIVECVVTQGRNELGSAYRNNNDKLLDKVAPDGRLLVIYSDPEYRNTLPTEKKFIWKSEKISNKYIYELDENQNPKMDKDGNFIQYLDPNNDGYFDEWYDLGEIQDIPGGILIYKKLNNEAAEQLLVDGNPPESVFGDDKYAGWMAAIQENELDPITIKFYDYNTQSWHTVDERNDEAVKPQNVVQIRDNIDNFETIPVKEEGLVFINKDNVIQHIVEKTDRSFTNPYYFSSFAKYITPTLNAGVNTLEEQLLIGFNTITEEWVDDDKNTHIKTKFLMNENEQEYYILHSTIFDNNNLKGSNFIITDSTLTFDNNKDQSFELKTNENGEEYYSLSFNNTEMYSFNENGEINVTTDILVKEDILSIYKDNIITDIYKKQVTIQLANNGHKFTKEKIINLIS